MPRFTPVFLPPERAIGGKGSQTMLRHYSGCPRAGYLYALHKGSDAKTAEMVRGTAVHLIHERAVRLMLENGEVTIPETLVKALADEVLAELPVPFWEHDSVREMAYRIGSEVSIDPATVVAAETLFAVDVPVDCPRGCNMRPDMVAAGMICPSCHGDRMIQFEVRCRIDFAELLDEGRRVHVEDLKSSKAAVPQDEIARKRPDGSLSAKAFQLVLYAIALTYGVPVREEPCELCGGGADARALALASEAGIDTADAPVCPACKGKGRVETREPFPVASRAQSYDLEFVYPAIPGSDGKMLRRGVTLTRSELEQYRVSLAGLVGRLLRDEVSGEWPAVVSDQACGECPASAECPLEDSVKDHRGTINTPVECAEALEVYYRQADTQRAKGKEIRKFVEVHGPVRFGGGMVAEIQSTVSTEIRDKDAFLAAVDVTVQYGQPLDRSLFLKEKTGARLVKRPLLADEIDSEGSRDDE